jgi:hypothetical protein
LLTYSRTSRRAASYTAARWVHVFNAGTDVDLGALDQAGAATSAELVLTTHRS